MGRPNIGSARQGGKSSSFFLLLTIVGFSVGLLAGYIFLGSPGNSDQAVSRAASDVQGGRKQLAGAGKASVLTPQTRELISAPNTAPPPPPSPAGSGSAAAAAGASGAVAGVSIGQGASQSEDVKHQMMKQASATDEHQSAKQAAEKQLMKQQMGDKSEVAGRESSALQAQKDAALGNAGGHASSSSSSSSSGGSAASENSTGLPGQQPYPGQKLQFTPSGATLTADRQRFPSDSIHTLFTSNGSPYQNFQARIMVATWNLVRKMPGGQNLVAMTRILHRTTPDEVMDEIPTFIAQPLQPECDKWCWFPVADRANAVHQFINSSLTNPSLIKGGWLLLLETDYVWMRPLPSPGDAYDIKVPGWSFAFDYIAPRHPVAQKLLKDKCPTCDVKNLPNSGPAPVLARLADFRAATPLWEELSLWIETHEDAKKQLGWVREMYAWDIGVAANRLNIKNEGHPTTPLISQPPHDSKRFNASMYHYTWGSIFHSGGSSGPEVWKFDKRFYTAVDDALKVPPIPMPPAFTPGVVLQDGLTVTQDLHATLADMIGMMNQGIATLPDLRGKKAAAAA